MITSPVVGAWVDDSTTTYTSIMDQFAASAGAWYGFDVYGVLRMGRLSEPAGAAKAVLAEREVLEGMERRTPTDNGVPVYSVTVNHSKNYTVQTSGLAGSASSRQGFVSEEMRASNAADATIKTQWLLAGTLAVDTLLTTTAAGDAEAARLLAMYKVRRDLFDVPIDLSVMTAKGIWLLDVVKLDMARFSLNSGRLFRVIGIAFELSSNKVTLTVWG